MKKTLFLALTLMALLTTACHSKKQVTTSGDYQPTTTNTDNGASQLDTRLAAFASTQGGWNTMQAGGTVKVSGGKSLTSAMQMRMIRDKAIYISLRPMLGVEIGKIVITNDSLLVVDKYHKRYIAEPVSLITNGIPVTVSNLQDIFLGRAFILGGGSINSSSKDKVEIVADGDNYRLTPKTQPADFSYGFSIDGNNHMLSVSLTPNKGNSVPYTANYSDMMMTLAGYIAHHADVNASVRGSKFSLSLDLKNVTWNGQVNIDAAKPEGYKRMDGHQITSILNGN